MSGGGGRGGGGSGAGCGGGGVQLDWFGVLVAGAQSDQSDQAAAQDAQDGTGAIHCCESRSDAPKGQSNAALGNALGCESSNISSPEGASQPNKDWGALSGLENPISMNPGRCPGLPLDQAVGLPNRRNFHNNELHPDGTDKSDCATQPPAIPPPATPPPPLPPPPTAAELVFVRSHRARHYRITLKRDGVAVVTIPARGSEREARRFAAEHADWLARARKRQERRPRGDSAWGIGTEILWRGEMVRICVAPESTAGRAMVALGGKSFRVARLDADLRPALEAHFLRMAKIELPARAWELAAETRVPVTGVRVRNQRTRWGSCTGKGAISLNWRLVQAPVFVRDYIIYHELMHLREMNHSARFWKRVGEVCPYWEEAERWIKKNGGLLGM